MLNGSCAGKRRRVKGRSGSPMARRMWGAMGAGLISLSAGVLWVSSVAVAQPEETTVRQRQRGPRDGTVGGGAAGGGETAPRVGRGGFGGGLGEGFGGGELWSAPISTKDFDRYAKALGLSADQRESGLTLLEAMQEEYAVEAKRGREAFDALRQEFQSSRDPSVFAGKMPELMRSLRDKRTTLESSFLSDLRTLVPESQADRWASFERMRRRDGSVDRRGALGGEAVDLLRLVDELGLSGQAPAGAGTVLDQYEMELDRALVARDAALEKVEAMMGQGGFAALRELARNEEFTKRREEVHAARLKVRETNRRSERQLEAALGEAEATRLREAFQRASYPQVYRESFAQESLEAAERFDDLSAEQRAALGALRESFDREVGAANERLIAAIDKADESADAAGGFEFGGGERRVRIADGDGASGNPSSEAREARRGVETRFLENLRSLLSDGQRERLPKPRARQGERSVRLPGGQTVEINAEFEDGALGEGEAVFVARLDAGDPDAGADEVVEANIVVIQKGEGGREDVFEFHSKEPESKPQENAPKKP